MVINFLLAQSFFCLSNSEPGYFLLALLSINNQLSKAISAQLPIISCSISSWFFRPQAAPVQRRPGAEPRGQPGGGAAGPAGEAELRTGPDEGAHVVAVVAGLRGGTGAGDGPQGPHQVRRDEQQVPEGHQRGVHEYTRTRTHSEETSVLKETSKKSCQRPIKSMY